MFSFLNIHLPPLLSPASSIIVLLLLYALVFYVFLLLTNRNKSSSSGFEYENYQLDHDESNSSHELGNSSNGLCAGEVKRIGIPSFYYGVGWSSGCVICLEGFQHREQCRVFEGCNHIFHAQCVDPWLVRRFTCPLCRAHVHIIPGAADS